MLRAIFFDPLVLLLRFLYQGFYGIIGNYGFSLLTLSLAMSVLLRPLMRWASERQMREKRLQEILKPQAEEICAEFQGERRHRELSELYRRYGWHPVLALRSNVGLLVQLPFLIAAYVMLSSMPELSGVSFGPISDLSRPDALLLGFNVLPGLMTLVNLSAAWTTPSFGRREKVQASILAFLFFVLLYGAPSALLVYWTGNNLILLLRNLLSGKTGHIHRGMFAKKDIQLGNSKETFLHAMVFLGICGIWGLYIIFFGRAYVALRYDSTIENVVKYISLNAVLFAFVTLGLFLWNSLKKLYNIYIYIYDLLCKLGYIFIGGGVLLYYSLVFIPQVFQSGTGRSFFLGIFCILLLLYVLAGGLFLPYSWYKFSTRLELSSGFHLRRLFYLSVIFFVLFFGFFYPALLYSSSPSFFGVPLFGLLEKILSLICAMAFGALLFYFAMPDAIKNLLSFLLALLVCVACINAFLLTDSAGDFDTLIFRQGDLEDSIGAYITYIKDVLVFLVSFFFLVFSCRKKWLNTFSFGILILVLALLTAGGYYCHLGNNAAIFQTQENQAASPSSLLPAWHGRLWRFSKTGKNVLGLFWDMFTGGHMENILSMYPEIKEQLDGFIWYPDMVSTGAGTSLSTLSIYGGPQYDPLLLDRQEPGTSKQTKANRANSFLANAFSSRGYDVALAGTPFIRQNDDEFQKYLSHPESVLLVCDEGDWGDNWGKAYEEYWKQWRRSQASYQPKELWEADPDYTSFFLSLGFLRILPFSLRPGFYNGGNWRGETANQILLTRIKEHWLPNLPASQFMSDFISVDEGKPTFKILRSVLSHSSWHLSSEDSVLPVVDPYPATEGQFTLVDGLYPEHLYTEVHMIRFLVQLIKRMKELGVYDNTCIVVFSDHGVGDSPQLNRKVGRSVYKGNPHALLLYKNFKVNGPLVSSDALMTCGDIPTLLTGELAPYIKGIPSMDELRRLSGPDRVRTHYLAMPERFDLQKTLFNAIPVSVKGTMFKKENWSKGRYPLTLPRKSK